VRVLQCVGDLAGDLERLGDGKLSLALEARAERLAFDERHDVEQPAVAAPAVEQRQDVRVLEAGGELDLLEKPLGPEDGRELGVQDLEGDLAPVPNVFGKVDGRHAALTQFPVDPVSVRERGDKTIGGRAHRAASSTARFIRATQFGITRR
jgi:hypothetical protein